MKISNVAEYVLHENENSKGYNYIGWVREEAQEEYRNNTHFDDKIGLMNYIDRYNICNKTPCVCV